MTTQRAGWMLLVASSALIGLMTLQPQLPAALMTPWCLRCGGLWLSDWILNAIAFAPIGVALVLLMGSWWRATLLAMVVSSGVEMLQRYVIAGRNASVGDIVSNTIGAAIAAIVACHFAGLIRPREKVGRALAGAAAALWLLLLVFTGWTARRSIGERTLYGQWAPDLAHLAQFRGTLVSASIGVERFPWGPVQETPRFRERLLRDPLTVSATIIPARATDRVAPIVSVFDDHSQEAMLLGQAGHALVFRVRTNASDVGLWSPEAVLTDAIPHLAGSADSVTVRATWAGSEIRLQSARRGDQDSRSNVTKLGPRLGWTLFVPPSAVSPITRSILTAVWLGILLMPTAYWCGAIGRPFGPLLLGASMILGLLVLPVWQRTPLAGATSTVGLLVLATFSYAIGRHLAGPRSGVPAPDRFGTTSPMAPPQEPMAARE